MRDLKVKI